MAKNIEMDIIQLLITILFIQKDALMLNQDKLGEIQLSKGVK